MGLFSRKDKAGSSSGSKRINLKDILDSNEIRILISDLTVAADKGGSVQTLNRIRNDIEGSGTISVTDLDTCINAVQAGLGVFAFFNMVPSGHAGLLPKLQKLKEQA